MIKDASSNSAVLKSENMEEYITSSYPCPMHYVLGSSSEPGATNSESWTR
jgi:hypothetical protein